jgi:pyridoxal phosphate enzyme (YggS family)
MNKTDLKKRLDDLNAEINEKAANAVLVAVSKYSSVEDVLLAYSLGQMDFGENRVADLEAKAQSFKLAHKENVRWHFIGTLQTNKVRDLLRVPNLHSIHSVSSLKLLEEIIKRESEFQGSELKLFFQLNTSHEEEKSGFETVLEVIGAMELLLAQKDSKLRCYGLMTMGSIRSTDFEGAAKESFHQLKEARDLILKQLNLHDLKLSMGMSQDYKIALSEGADYVRVGSLIFKA